MTSAQAALAAYLAKTYPNLSTHDIIKLVASGLSVADIDKYLSYLCGGLSGIAQLIIGSYSGDANAQAFLSQLTAKDKRMALDLFLDPSGLPDGFDGPDDFPIRFGQVGFAINGPYLDPDPQLPLSRELPIGAYLLAPLMPRSMKGGSRTRARGAL